MTDVRRALATAVLPVTLLAGCGDEASDRPDPAEATMSATDPEPSPTSSTPSPSDSPTDSPAGGPLVAQAVADLAQRLGVEEGSIEVVSQEEVTWSDGSLGCAEPGELYTQAMVDGSRIVLRAGGREHEYHSGAGAPPFLCEKPTQ